MSKIDWKSIKINLIGVYLLIFLLILIIIPIVVYRSSISDSLYRALYYLGSAGGLGGLVYCIRGYYKALVNQDKEPFDLHFTWWYILRPFISIVVGVFVYFLIVGGLLSVSNISSSQLDLTKSVPFYCSLSFIGGYCFSQFADKLDQLGGTVFGQNETPKGQQQTKEQQKQGTTSSISETEAVDE